MSRLKNKTYRPRGEFLFEKEIDLILSTLRRKTQNPIRNTCLVLMMYRHGLRVSEACNLKWGQIDLENKTVSIERLKGSKNGTHYLEEDELVLLKKLKEKGKVYCFTSVLLDRPLSRDTVHMLIERAGQDAEIPFPVHPHMLKHSCGYALVSKNIDIRVIQGYMGHKSIANTILYTEISPERFKGIWS